MPTVGAERATGAAAERARLLQPEVLAALSNLTLAARAAVEGTLVGLHRSPRFGFSQEFAEYRPYREGDDPQATRGHRRIRPRPHLDRARVTKAPFRRSDNGD